MFFFYNVKRFFFNVLKWQEVKYTPCKSFEFMRKNVSNALDSHNNNIGFHNKPVMDDELLDEKERRHSM